MKYLDADQVILMVRAPPHAADPEGFTVHMLSSFLLRLGKIDTKRFIVCKFTTIIVSEISDSLLLTK